MKPLNGKRAHWEIASEVWADLDRPGAELPGSADSLAVCVRDWKLPYEDRRPLHRSPGRRRKTTVCPTTRTTFSSRHAERPRPQYGSLRRVTSRACQIWVSGQLPDARPSGRQFSWPCARLFPRARDGRKRQVRPHLNASVKPTSIGTRLGQIHHLGQLWPPGGGAQ